MTTTTERKPQAVSVNPDGIPAELKELRQWVLWSYDWRQDKSGKWTWTKVPKKPNNRNAATDKPTTWTTFEVVVESYRLKGDTFDGIGFVFSVDDDFLGIDLDACRHGEDGTLTPWAENVVTSVNSYCEVSPSGEGVKIVTRGKLPIPAYKTGRVAKLNGVATYGDKSPEVAIFDKKRFWCLTGQRLDSTPATVEARQEPLDAIWQQYITKPKAEKRTTSKSDNDKAPATIEALIDECRKATAGSRSEIDFRLCATAIRRGWAREQLWERVKNVGKFGERGRDYFDRTWNNAEGEAAVIANCIEDKTEEGTVIIPVRMSDIIENARKLTGNWPRRVADALFVHSGDDIAFLTSESHLFGFYHRIAGGVLWKGGKRLVNKREYFAELQRTATAYDAVERLPHEPRLSTHYYACREVAAGRGDYLRRLLDRFSPATDIDRDLILAAMMTPAWGGPAGTRPAFVVTSQHGRGVGKTTLAEMVGLLWGGILSFSHREDIGKVKTRLLTPDALTRRVCLLDNVKSLKFSWSDLEGMITCTTIGGHRLYIGEGTRPNTLTWFVTLNGASLSTDMAQRSVVIELDRPTRSGEWSDETRQFIVDHQKRIIADIIGVLRQEPYKLDRYSRWATWEREVLARLPEPSDAQRVIEERQVGVDVEAEEAATIEEHFASKLRWLRYDPEREWVFVPSRVANAWYCEAQNDRVTTSQSTRMLKQLGTEGRLKRLHESRRGDLGRGFLWTAEGIGTAIAIDLQERLKDATSG